jgi:hypothetical protein
LLLPAPQACSGLGVRKRSPILYLFLASALLTIGALCTALAFELLFYYMAPVLFWLFLPCPLLAAAAPLTPLHRLTEKFMHDNEERFAQARQILKDALKVRWQKSLTNRRRGRSPATT